MAAKPKLSIRSFTTRLDSASSPETKITRLPWSLTGPLLKCAMRMELNALTMRAPGAKPATISLAPMPPRSARTRLGLVSANGLLASMRTPLGQGAQGRLDFLPRHGEQHVAQTGRLLDGRRRGASAELSRLAGKSAGTASTAQDNLMSTSKRLPRNRKRNLTGSDRPNPHRSVLSMLRGNELLDQSRWL